MALMSRLFRVYLMPVRAALKVATLPLIWVVWAAASLWVTRLAVVQITREVISSAIEEVRK